MSEVKVGTVVRDNDPRCSYRQRVVSRINEDGRVLLKHPAIEKLPGTWVRLDRIHTDGKPRKSGWSVAP